MVTARPFALGFSLYLAFLGGCASPAQMASAPPPMIASTGAAPSASAARVEPPPPAPTSTPPVPSGGASSPNPGFQAPAGFVWIDSRAGYALAQKHQESDAIVACEVIEIASRKVVAKITGNDTNAGGADPQCTQLAPLAHLVEIGNGRGMFWKNWKDQTTACTGVVAPDESTCIEDDTSPFFFVGTIGPAVDLELRWSTAVVNGTSKKIVTIPRGRNRNVDTERWWTVEYCSPDVAVIDDKKGQRTTIDATKGVVRSSKKSDGSPRCP